MPRHRSGDSTVSRQIRQRCLRRLPSNFAVLLGGVSASNGEQYCSWPLLGIVPSRIKFQSHECNLEGSRGLGWSRQPSDGPCCGQPRAGKTDMSLVMTMPLMERADASL